MMGSPGMRQFAPKSPYGVNFDNVNLIKKNEQRQYREDLDYLISLRRRLGDEEFDRLYGTDLLRRVQRMDDVNIIKIKLNILEIRLQSI